MASEVSICNRALQLLGADTIIALTDDTSRARTMATAYQAVRDAELERRKWRFAIKRVQLAALSTAPVFGYAYQYQVPNDYLRLIPGGDLVSVADLSDYRTGSSALYVVEGDKILTDLGAPLSIRYLARIEDSATFSPSFSEALSARLADDCCERITQSDSKRQLAMAAYSRAVKEAVRANAIEAAPESQADGEWIMARTQ